MSLAAETISVTLGGKPVLSDFDLTVAPGELVAVVGPNGAGKSTALRVIAGLLAPDRGRVVLDGASPRDLPRRELARQVAYIPQDRTVHWSLAVDRVVALGRLPHRSFAAAENDSDRIAIEAAMRRMDIMHLAQRPIATLSGGERARALVARALSQDAQYLIADEPTAGLDPAHTLQLFEEFTRLARDGRAVITALHDLSLAARYATRIVLMKDGCCLASGRADEVLSTQNFSAAFGITAAIAHVQGIPVVVPLSPLP